MYENRSDKLILFELSCASSSCPHLNCEHTSRWGVFHVNRLSLLFSSFAFRCLYLRSREGGREGEREWDGLNISNLISGAGKQRTP